VQPVPIRPALPPCPHEAALSAAQTKIANLETALTTARRISMAVGILMATYKVTDEAAFDLLVYASQQSHRKLRDIAEQVLQTGSLNWRVGDNAPPSKLQSVPNGRSVAVADEPI
jgi:hypothetical protein